MKPFTSTARLQFHKDFTMDMAAALVPYYASLGISHFYASPLLKSRPGPPTATTSSTTTRSTRNWAGRRRYSAWWPCCASTTWAGA